MSVNGIGHLYLETHNWGETVSFWQSLGYRLTFETDHHSGRLDPPSSGPYLFIAEVPTTKEPDTTIYLDVTGDFPVAGDAEATHWGTEILETTDADGRIIRMERPVGA